MAIRFIDETPKSKIRFIDDNLSPMERVAIPKTPVPTPERTPNLVDVSDVGKALFDAIEFGRKKASSAISRTKAGEITPAEGVLRGASGVKQVVESPISGLIELISEYTPGFVKEPIKKGISATMQTAPAQKVAEKVGEFKEERPRAYENIASIADLAELIPVAKGYQVAKKSLPKVASKIDDALRVAKKVDVPPVKSTKIKDVSDILDVMSVEDVKKSNLGQIAGSTGEIVDVGDIPKASGLPLLRDLQESEIRLMREAKAPKTIPFSKYAKQAELKKRLVKEITPNELAGTNATKAFKKVDQLRKEAGSKIDDIVKNNPDAMINIADVKNNYLQMLDDRIGMSGVSASGQELKLGEDIGEFILSLPDEISAKDAVNLKRNLRNQVKYTPEGQFRGANTTIDGIIKQTASSVDQKLDVALKGFREANEAYAKVKRLEDSFSRALGKEINIETGITKHGSQIMKLAVESNAQPQVREIFRQVKELTDGEFDLFQDATYASIAMKYSNDPKQMRMAFYGIPVGTQGGGGVKSKLLNLGETAALGRYKENRLGRIAKWYEKNQPDPWEEALKRRVSNIGLSGL